MENEIERKKALLGSLSIQIFEEYRDQLKVYEKIINEIVELSQRKAQLLAAANPESSIEKEEHLEGACEEKAFV